MTDPPLDAGPLIRRLHASGVEYIVIGGLAVIAHGVQRFTNDLDICHSPDRDNLARLATALQEADARVGDRSGLPAIWEVERTTIRFSGLGNAAAQDRAHSRGAGGPNRDRASGPRERSATRWRRRARA